MPIPYKVKKLRLNIAKDLDFLARLFEANGLNSEPIIKAASQLKSDDPVVYDGIGQSDYWGYEVNNLCIPFSENPEIIHPKDADLLELRINCKIIADSHFYNTMADPLIHLDFEVLIEALSEEKNNSIYTGFHIDRHLDGAQEPAELHPFYHIHFGGRRLNHDTCDYGRSLFLGAPRILCYPIDLILGIDIIICNYFPSLKKAFHRDHNFISILKEQQNLFWKPFFHSLASQWSGYNAAANIWLPKKIWPQLI